MVLWRLFQSLGHDARVATAVAPFLLALACRVMFGGTRVTHWMTALGAAWFVVNVFLAPYSPQMRQDILRLRGWLP